MKLSIKSVAITLAIIWGVAVFLVGLGHLLSPDYGTAFLGVVASVYPGYEVGGFGSVIVGTLYAALDGAIGGAIFAWLYNKLAA
jgi:hypothetical protein